jgi:hypothetical protein
MNMRGWYWIPLSAVLLVISTLQQGLYYYYYNPLNILGIVVMAIVIEWLYNKFINKPKDVKE